MSNGAHSRAPRIWGPGLRAGTMVALSEGGICSFRIRGKYGALMPLNDRPRLLDHEGHEKMFAAGAAHNLAMTFPIGKEDLPEVGRTCEKYAETSVILDHVRGGRMKEGVFPEQGIQRVCELAEHKRAMLKLRPIHALGGQGTPYLDVLPIVRATGGRFRTGALHVGER